MFQQLSPFSIHMCPLYGSVVSKRVQGVVSRVIHCNFSVQMNLKFFGGQALCSTVGQQPGRRTANGVDGQRLSLLLAVS